MSELRVVSITVLPNAATLPYAGKASPTLSPSMPGNVVRSQSLLKHVVMSRLLLACQPPVNLPHGQLTRRAATASSL